MNGMLAITSSGDDEKDQERLRRFIENDEKIQAGECPNDCGPMVRRESEGLSECQKCGFVYSGGI